MLTHSTGSSRFQHWSFDWKKWANFPVLGNILGAGFKDPVSSTIRFGLRAIARHSCTRISGGGAMNGHLVPMNMKKKSCGRLRCARCCFYMFIVTAMMIKLCMHLTCSAGCIHFGQQTVDSIQKICATSRYFQPRSNKSGPVFGQNRRFGVACDSSEKVDCTFTCLQLSLRLTA